MNWLHSCQLMYNVFSTTYLVPQCLIQSLKYDTTLLFLFDSYNCLYQVVTWAIDQKNEDKLEAEMKRIGASFHFWEERGDKKSSNSIKKYLIAATISRNGRSNQVCLID